MDIQTTYSETSVFIKISGSINNENSIDLKENFINIDTSNLQKIRFDLSNLKSISSTGIGKFLVLYKKMLNEDVAVEIMGISQELFDTWKSLKLDKVIPIVSNKGDSFILDQVNIH